MPNSHPKLFTPTSLFVDTLARIVERSREGILLLDDQDRVLYANERALEMLGRSPWELARQNLWEVFPALTDTPLYKEARLARQHQEEVELTGNFGLTEDAVQYRLMPTAQGLVITFVEGSLDLSASNQVYERTAEILRDSEARTQQVRQLASVLTLAEQNERRRVARILHDDFQQQLYALQLRLFTLRRQIRDPELQKGFEQADGFVAEALRTARELMIDLSPPVLQGEGLGKALRWLCGEMARRFEFRVEIREHTDVPVPREDMRVLLFQIVRELLFNALKHSQADHAHVVLRIDGPDLLIEVIDQGTGFESKALQETNPQGNGVGLRTARERLLLFGGRMAITSRPGQGTCVTLVVPIRNL